MIRGGNKPLLACPDRLSIPTHREDRVLDISPLGRHGCCCCCLRPRCVQSGLRVLACSSPPWYRLLARRLRFGQWKGPTKRRRLACGIVRQEAWMGLSSQMQVAQAMARRRVYMSVFSSSATDDASRLARQGERIAEARLVLVLSMIDASGPEGSQAKQKPRRRSSHLCVHASKAGCQGVKVSSLQQKRRRRLGRRSLIVIARMKRQSRPDGLVSVRATRTAPPLPRACNTSIDSSC